MPRFFHASSLGLARKAGSDGSNSFERYVRSVLAPFVAMPCVTSSSLLLVARPGAPSGVLAPQMPIPEVMPNGLFCFK